MTTRKLQYLVTETIINAILLAVGVGIVLGVYAVARIRAQETWSPEPAGAAAPASRRTSTAAPASEAGPVPAVSAAAALGSTPAPSRPTLGHR